MDGITPEEIEENNDLPLMKEYKWDFENNKFDKRNGKLQVVEGLEAIEIWIYKVLLTERYKWFVYSWDFGNELKGLIGTQYSPELVKSKAVRQLRECLLVNPYINNITNIRIDLSDDELQLEFKVNTIYGEVLIGVPRE